MARKKNAEVKEISPDFDVEEISDRDNDSGISDNENQAPTYETISDEEYQAPTYEAISNFEKENEPPMNAGDDLDLTEFFVTSPTSQNLSSFQPPNVSLVNYSDSESDFH